MNILSGGGGTKVNNLIVHPVPVVIHLQPSSRGVVPLICFCNGSKDDKILDGGDV